MNHIIHTMSLAHRLITDSGQPFSFENNCITNMFILPSVIESFHDDALFLKFIETLIQERSNFPFPENPKDYECYITDCLCLKDQMNPFSEETWLFCITRLFENLKTPYYSVYSKTLLALEKGFTDHRLFLSTLQNFYSFIIKSTPEKQQLIQKIAEQVSSYRPLIKEESLLADLFSYQLSIFGDEKDFWFGNIFSQLYTDTIFSPEKCNIECLLFSFQEKEKQFLTYLNQNSSLNISLPDYLSQRTYWFIQHREMAPDNLFYSQKKYTGTLQLPSDSFLNKYAYNMTTSSYITNPAIGREQEISDLELILISPKKSPILLGEAGVGKTSVVEGLAWRLQQGNVPTLLKNKSIYKLTTTTLLSGTKYVGEMEERIRQLMKELEDHPDLILFIDEIHTIVGAGSTESSNNDISNMIKPYIDRGDIKIIGSTTSEEYRKYLLTDKALARRFYPIAIEEPTDSVTLDILIGTIPSIEYETKVKNHFSEEKLKQLLQILIQLSSVEYQPEDHRTRCPELPLTLLEMAFSYAALHSKEFISLEDFICAVRHTNLLKKEIRMHAEQYFLEEANFFHINKKI